VARPKIEEPKTSILTVRLTPTERQQIDALAARRGHQNLASLIRAFLKSDPEYRYSVRDGDFVSPVAARIRAALRPVPFPIETRLGRAYLGDSIGLLHQVLQPNSVDLIMTSPPFGLVRKKAYGNEDADAYVDWFRPFAEGFRRVLKPEGSLVIDIGGAWKPGLPTRSLYHFELLLTLCRDYEFHLAQEFYWWNPAKLPTPAEWVNVRRVRVKDAVNCIWWLSPTAWPKASNRRVLQPYSESMRELFKNGYTPKLRPSGHDISKKFGRDNSGSIPPNLLALANTESNGAYQKYCQAHGLPRHPARFPAGIPEHFIRMLTDRSDLVVDPFAGSCVTGEVCEKLGRRWICCEIDPLYLEGARARFERQRRGSRAETGQLFDLRGKVKGVQPYEIFPPCSLANGDESPLPADGGRRRHLTAPPSEASSRKTAHFKRRTHFHADL
jgi:site-specific DNA-methyltransferase (cytosine-N4-specific)